MAKVRAEPYVGASMGIRTPQALLALAATVGGSALLIVADPVGADSRMTTSGRVLYFRNEDAGIANRLTVDTDAKGRAHFIDDADPYGMNYPGGDCSPGKINNSGNVVEVFCDKGRFDSITIQTGPGEDAVAYAIEDRPATLEGGVGADVLKSAGAKDELFGGQGNDVLEAGAGDDVLGGDEGDDTLRGQAGNDRLDAGVGFDVVEGGDGDDTVRAADGYADKIDCGSGADTVTADQADTPTNCETVTRAQVAGPSGAAAGPDTRRPAVQVGGSTSQRVSTRTRRIAVAVTVSEPARIDVSGFLDAAGLNDRLTPRTARVAVGGGGTVVRVPLSAKQIRRALAQLRKHRRVRVTVTVSAVDAAGNPSRSRHLTIALRRG
jgi:hypothetical protein